MEFTKTANWFVRYTNPTCKPYSSLRTWQSEPFREGLEYEKSEKITKTHEGEEWVLISERKGREIPNFSPPSFWMILTWKNSSGKEMREEYVRAEEECWLHEIEKCSFEKRQIY